MRARHAHVTRTPAGVAATCVSSAFRVSLAALDQPAGSPRDSSAKKGGIVFRVVAMMDGYDVVLAGPAKAK